MQSWLVVSWQVLVVRGVVAALFGIVAMVWPEPTLIVVVVLWGVWALLDGISSLAQAFRPGPGLVRLGLALMGVVALAAAIFAIFRPVDAGTILAWFLGVWLLVRGVLEAVLAFVRTPALPRWLLLLSAALDIVLGLLFVTHPGKSALAIAWLLGLLALIWGLLFIVVGLMARKNTELPGPPPAVAV
jgi:uncharacterized membrane protein HdeD (DUF308 family)